MHVLIGVRSDHLVSHLVCLRLVAALNVVTDLKRL